MISEGKIKAQVKIFLNSLDSACWCYMPIPMGYGRRGIPDFIGCLHGEFFTIETKRTDGKAKPWQEREAINICAAGGKHWLVNTPEQLEMFKSWANSVVTHAF